MSNDNGKWLPYNLDGTAHECRPTKQETATTTRTTNTNVKLTLSLESLDQKMKEVSDRMDQRLKRLEHAILGDN